MNSSDLFSAATSGRERPFGQIIQDPCHPLRKLFLFVPSLLRSPATVVIYSILLLRRNVLTLLLSSSVNRCAFQELYRFILCNAFIRSNFVMCSPTAASETIEIILFYSKMKSYFVKKRKEN